MLKYVKIIFLILFSGLSVVAQPQTGNVIPPEPMPQTPVAPKLTSDAADEGLKGKVKNVVEESEGISEMKNGRYQRQMSQVLYFNEKGNFLQRDHYDYRGNLYQLTVFGYIDGKRVNKSKFVSYDYDAPAPAPGKRTTGEMEIKPDTRYEYSYEYQFQDGKMAEKRLISNRGILLQRFVYYRSKYKIDSLVYLSNGELNQKFLLTLDKKGNVVEEVFFGLSNYDLYGDKKYRYEYEFDKKGNWIKKIATVEMNENGIVTFKPAYVKYRTITYY